MNFLHCPECGTRYVHWADGRPSWPKKCLDCGEIAWRNPTPVVAVLQPVMTPRGVALGIAKRAIPPKQGHWSLIGGFMEVRETVEEAALREFREETGLATTRPRFAFSASVGADGAQLMLMTYVDKAMPIEVFQTGVPCPENEELGLLYPDSSIELAFPTHRDAAKRFFAGEFPWQA